MKTWSCPNKQEARKKTIIELYRKYFNIYLPLEKQYWSTCGLCYDNGLIDGCELKQMVISKLIKEDQFYGVDKEFEIIEKNKSIKNSNWFYNDFITQIKSYNNFNPGIIDVDIIHLKERGSVYLGNLLSYITYKNIKEVLVVANMMLCNPNHGIEIYNGDDVIEELNRVNSFQEAWLSGFWKIHPYRYEYVGQKYGTRTILSSYIFIKKD